MTSRSRHLSVLKEMEGHAEKNQNQGSKVCLVPVPWESAKTLPRGDPNGFLISTVFP